MTAFLVRRSGALGDVILTTPAIRRLRQENPNAVIVVSSGYMDVFNRNPHVDSHEQHGGLPRIDSTDIVQTINLDMAYETRPYDHIVRAYMKTAFGDDGDGHDLRPEMFSPLSMKPQPRSIAIHPAAAGWENRTLPRGFWEHVVLSLDAKSIFVSIVGSARDSIDPSVMQKHGVIRECFRFGLHAQRAVIASSTVFIGSDSGMLHVAATTNTPILGLFTCARPELRMPIRDIGDRYVTSAVPCVGCLHDRHPPVTTEACLYAKTPNHNMCVKGFSPEQIVDIAVQMVNAATESPTQ